MQYGLVSIIILNYNGKSFNKNCIDSILKQIYKNFEIIFIDNASTDGSLEEVEQIFKKEISEGIIRVVKSRKNLGFDGGNNLGVKNVDKNSKYICLLNNDTIVKEDWLEELIKGIESDKRVGAVGPLVLNRGNEKKYLENILYRNKIPSGSLFGTQVFLNCRDKNKNLINVTSLYGCCILYKRDIINKPFEDFYFAYGEEEYFCWQLLYMGYTMKICTKSLIHHFEGGTSQNMSDLCLFHNTKNRIINYYIFLSWYNIVLLLPLFLMKTLLQIFSPRYKYPGYILLYKIKAYKRFIYHFNLIKRLRKNLRKNFTLSENEFINKIPFKLTSPLHPINGFVKFFYTVINGIFIGYGFFIKLINKVILLLGKR